MNINRMKILTKRDMMYIPEAKLQGLLNKGYIIEGECNSCNQNRNLNRNLEYNPNRVEKLAPSCTSYIKRYYGFNQLNQGDVLLSSIPGFGTGPNYTIKFYKDCPGTPPVCSTPIATISGQPSANYTYVLQSTDISTTPHSFHAGVIDEGCIGSMEIFDTCPGYYIVGLASLTAFPAGIITKHPGDTVNITFTKLDTVSAPYPDSKLNMSLVSTSNLNITIQSGTLTTAGCTINIGANTPNGSHNVIIRATTNGTIPTSQDVTIQLNITACTTPTCNFVAS